jgi:5-methylcytosine-specific restriction protein A
MTRACLVYACGLPVVTKGRCARHSKQVDEQRSVGSDRQAGRALYRSPQWRTTRAAVLTLHPFCECAECVAGNLPVRASVVHHRRPHGGDRALFFDMQNLQALAKACHDSMTAKTMQVEPLVYRAGVSRERPEVSTKGVA